MPKYEVRLEVPATVKVCVKAPNEKIAKQFLEGDAFLDVNGDSELVDYYDWCAADVKEVKKTTKGEPIVEIDEEGEEI